eukprot:scaffold3596_cov126-Cylindrotheca_fusiformis.AAC.3
MDSSLTETPPQSMVSHRDDSITVAVAANINHSIVTRRSPRKPQDTDICLPLIRNTSPSAVKHRKHPHRRTSSGTGRLIGNSSSSFECYLIVGWILSFVAGYCFLLHNYQITLPGRTLTVLNITNSNVNVNTTRRIPNLPETLPTNDEDADSERSSSSSYEEDGLVHILHSRFMQHQPSLIELGLARLELMEEFFLSSLQAQTSQNFLCVIRTDPELDATLLKRLLKMMKRLHHHFSFLVLASNESPHSNYMDISKMNDDAIVLGGNLEQARKYLAKSRNVLETRLDVDDGLNRFFVEDLQEAATSHLEQTSQWKIWCASSFVEWQFQSKTLGSGSLVSLRASTCITAGLSVVYVIPEDHSKKLEVPSTHKHSTLHETLPKCNPNKKTTTECFEFFSLHPTALRARTPSSAGMRNILWPVASLNPSAAGERRYRQVAASQKAAQAKLWKASDFFFDFDEPTARKIHGYLETHMKQIAQDNLKGQCTHGHSCKDDSRLLLQSIVKDYT